MKINSAEFIKGITKRDVALEGKKPQFAFIGRSNVGKSSVINSLTGKKDLAITSSFPGRTQEVNLFLINNALYFIDLPGYGYAKVPFHIKEKIKGLIEWYFFDSEYEQKKIFLIIDANVGPTKDDLEVLQELEEEAKNIIIIANKVDKIKKSEYAHKMKTNAELLGIHHKIIPYSSLKKIGIQEVLDEISTK